MPDPARAEAAVLTLSVVIPALNEADVIGECIAALLAQQQPVDEIIVVDNGSTDATASIASGFPGVDVVRESTPGIVAARTRGFAAATGDIIARIDADTVVDPGWAEAIRTAFADPSLAAVGGPVRQARASASVEHSTAFIYQSFRVIHRALFGGRVLLYGHNMAVRREAWLRVQPIVSLDDGVSEDIEIALAIEEAGGRVRFLPGMRARADVLRTMNPRKLGRYLRADGRTISKYRVAGWVRHRPAAVASTRKRSGAALPGAATGDVVARGLKHRG
ncbi:glycosyltransferase family A protein [Gryllotalpicola sp.]|uniref:glycosyltransferase n=1 Tax=Gryllotalpicola sp. TaxID=1932787 RepID=UPI002634FAB5|nr:glycosyltransferase family A protein [Gryllotalpicola sp.]